MTYIYEFFLPLAGIAVVIFLLNLLQYGIDSAPLTDTHDPDELHQATAKRDTGIDRRPDRAVADAIDTYRRAHETDDRERAKRERITIIVLIMTAIFAFAAAVAAGISAWIFQGQLREMQTANTVVQRAFITVKKLNIQRGSINRFINGVPESRFWMLSPEVENSGATPTQNLRWIVAPGFTFANRENLSRAAADVEKQTPNLTEAWNYGILGPHATMSLDYGGNASGILDTEIVKLAEGPLKMLFQGVIRYNDIFPNTQEHVTKFCYWIRAEIGGADPNSVGEPHGTQCGGNTNCADHECDTTGQQ
jgi:hypothetical protein